MMCRVSLIALHSPQAVAPKLPWVARCKADHFALEHTAPEIGLRLPLQRRLHGALSVRHTIRTLPIHFNMVVPQVTAITECPDVARSEEWRCVVSHLAVSSSRGEVVLLKV